MPNKTKSPEAGPLAFQLEVEFLDRLTQPVRDRKAGSVSAIIRAALERYDFTNLVVVRTAQVLISVRLPDAIRRTLKRTARVKHTSVGQLVRSAVEAYLPRLENGEGGLPAKPDDEGKPGVTRRRTQVAARGTGRKPGPGRRNMTKKRKG